MQHGNDKTNEKMDNELENESPGENLTCSAYKGWREREKKREEKILFIRLMI